MQTGHEDDHLSPSVGKIKNAWSCTSIPCLHHVVLYYTQNFTFLFLSDEERDEEAGATADGEREGEERSGSEKADSDHEEEAEKSEASPKEGSDGGLFYSVTSCREYKHFVKLQS